MFKVEDAVTPKLFVENNLLIIADYGGPRADEGRWNIIMNTEVETFHSTFKIKTFNTKKMTFSDWHEFDGSLVQSGELDGQRKIFVHDRWSYWVSELDHNEMVLRKKFRWPHQVLRVKSHELNGKRYWLVGSLNRASLARRLSFADIDYITSLQDITDGSFIDDGLITEDLFCG